MNPEIASSRSAKKRKKTLSKKAEELSILCGVPVGLVCIDPDGAVETWPKELEKIGEILEKTGQRSRDSDSGKGVKKAKKLRYQSWHRDLDYLPVESLIEILEDVERKEKILEDRKRMSREKNQRSKTGLGDRLCDDSDLSPLDSGAARF